MITIDLNYHTENYLFKQKIITLNVMFYWLYTSQLRRFIYCPYKGLIYTRCIHQNNYLFLYLVLNALKIRQMDILKVGQIHVNTVIRSYETN